MPTRNVYLSDDADGDWEYLTGRLDSMSAFVSASVRARARELRRSAPDEQATIAESLRTLAERVERLP